MSNWFLSGAQEAAGTLNYARPQPIFQRATTEGAAAQAEAVNQDDRVVGPVQLKVQTACPSFGVSQTPSSDSLQIASSDSAQIGKSRTRAGIQRGSGRQCSRYGILAAAPPGGAGRQLLWNAAPRFAFRS